MPITRLQMETVLAGPDLMSGLRGRALTARGAAVYVASAETLGAVPALGAILARALYGMAIVPLDPSDATDLDLALVADADFPELVARADLAALEAVIAAMNAPDEQSGEDRQDWAKLRAMYVADAERLRARLVAEFGDVGGVSCGTLDLAFSGPRWP